jgi:hypothetical protein
MNMPAMVVMMMAMTAEPNATGDAVIRGAAGPSEIVITTTKRMAGAITSLTWNGKQFIDAADHGRELQSAMNADLGQTFHVETFNPTEAGSMWDGDRQTSTSKLLKMIARGNHLESTTQMAFWLRPGEKSGGFPAINTTTLSNHLLTKRVTIGYKNLPHAVQYDVTFFVPHDEKHRYLQFESITGYMPAEFNTFFGVNAATKQLEPLDHRNGEQPKPVVLATADGKFAMGCYSPPPPSEAEEAGKPGYGRFYFEHARVSKWNCVFRVHARQGEFCRTGDYHFRGFVAVGTLEDVRATIAGLMEEFAQR